MERIGLVYILYTTNTLRFCATKITKLKQTLSYRVVSHFQKILSFLVHSSASSLIFAAVFKTVNHLLTQAQWMALHPASQGNGKLTYNSYLGFPTPNPKRTTLFSFLSITRDPSTSNFSYLNAMYLVFI